MKLLQNKLMLMPHIYHIMLYEYLKIQNIETLHMTIVINEK